MPFCLISSIFDQSEEKVMRLSYDVTDLSKRFKSSVEKQEELEQSNEDMETRVNTYELKLGFQANEVGYTY